MTSKLWYIVAAIVAYSLWTNQTVTAVVSPTNSSAGNGLGTTVSVGSSPASAGNSAVSTGLGRLAGNPVQRPVTDFQW